MILVLLIITLIGTIAAVSISSYAAYISSQISGEKLLTLNSRLGYKYATTYHTWQTAAVIAVIAALILWVLFIFVFVKRHSKKRQLKVQKSGEQT